MSDYKHTIFLPQTSFPMKGNLPKKEPQLLERWAQINLYKKIRQKSQGREKFILHEGPPYANGHLHIGHAFTGIFKDVVVRFQQMLGKDAPLVPGWDCHGLPIEWKIEEKYRKAGKRKSEIPRDEFRKECRDFAAHWVAVQKEEAKRWGRVGDWENPYITMDFEAEAEITAELIQFLENGSLYKGFRPIMWSVVEQTALAEAEIEYQNLASKSIYVRFPVQSSPLKELEGSSALIWTTTTWTLPANRGIAYGEDMTYVLIQVDETTAESLGKKGETLVMAWDLLASLTQLTGIAKYTVLKTFPGKDLAGTQCVHCLHGRGYDFDVPLLPGHHVTTEAGTGLVHTAPSHGPEDFEIGQKHGLETPEIVQEDGLYADEVPLFGGQHIFKAGEAIREEIIRQGNLLYQEDFVHSYPHSWRSKKPLIYRITSQWFISMEKNDLRKKALQAIEKVNWFPAQSQKRIHGMVADRPDWCISRQRAWGVPITIFVDRKTKQPLIDPKVNQRILEIIRKEGCDAWFKSDPARFLAPEYHSKDYEQVQDILDVWFDSGSTQRFVLEARPELQNPADLYLEGSDQHRGWFQSSLLVGCGTRGHAPYKSVVTHGFVLDERGYKMSKSSGNVVAPETVIQKSGAENLRLWVVNSDYRDDSRVGPEILKHQQDVYRRFRNTLRYLLGALSDFDPEEKIMDLKELPELEQWVLHRLVQMDASMRTCVENYDFLTFFNQLHTFCSVELSAFYFDIRKDVLYCDDPKSRTRRATRTVMNHLATYLIHWLAPALCFTAEEAWLTLHPSEDDSIHLQTFPEVPQVWLNEALGQKFEALRSYRRVMTGALEKARADGLIGSSLQANLTVYDPDRALEKLLTPSLSLESLAIVSKVDLVPSAQTEGAFTLVECPGIGVQVTVAEADKCARCWKVLAEVGSHETYADLCDRCAEVVSSFGSNKEEAPHV